MRWAAIFTDIADGAAIRDVHTEAHQAYLRRYKGRIVLAGSLRPDTDAAPKGGLWIFEAESRAEVERIIAEDPFQSAGLRATTEIFFWTTAPGFEDMEIGAR